MMLLLAAALMVGCKKETENNGNNETTETVGHKNPNPAQDTPLSENFFPEFESIYQLHLNTDGTFYALAGGEHTDFLLKLSSNGSVMDKKELGFRSRRCMVVTGEHIILIGNLDYTDSPYSMSQKGYVAAFDHALNMVATLSLSEPQYKIEINTIIQETEDPTVFIVGGSAVDNSYLQYPYLCGIEFLNGLMTKLDNKILSEYPKYRIVGMVEKSLSGQSDLILETVRYSVIDDPYNANSSTVHIIKPNVNEDEWGWGNFTWDIAIEGSHGDSYTGNNSIDSDENNIYFFGYCNDDKEPASSDGGYWKSGCVAAVNWRQGQLAWKKTISLTNKDEKLLEGQVLDGYLYACGNHSGLGYSSTKKYFSNGLVAKLSLSGELVGYKTFGDPQRRSYLFNFVKDNNGNIVCVGHSDENVGNYKTKWSAWFLKTDMSSATQKALPAANQEERDNDLDAASGTAPMGEDRHCGGM